jgi:hypothetical protein
LPWLKRLDGALLDPPSGEGEPSTAGAAKWHGLCYAKLIFRVDIRSNFADWVTSVGPQLKRMAQDLFDRYGRLRPEFKDHPYMRGSGIWGDELNVGNILLIERLLADKHVRYRGKGRAIFNEVLENAHANSPKDSFIVITCIDKGVPLTLEDEAKMEHKMRDGVSFIRSLGFRRLGNTPWFAYSVQPGHKSRAMLPGDDYDPPSVVHPTTNLYEFAFHIIPWNDEVSCLRFFKDCLDNVDSSELNWASTNKRGRTVMHEAALHIYPSVLGLIMEHAPQLTVTRDSAGATPFEALTLKLERKRTFHPDALTSGARPDEFVGYNPDEVACIRILDTSNRTKEQIRFGCTCGHCEGGYLSPRMTKRLELHADYISRHLLSHVDTGDAPYYAPINSMFDPGNKHMKAILHPHTRIMFLESLSLRHGFANHFAFLSQCLALNFAPTDINLVTILLNSGVQGEQAREFFEHGGSCQMIRSITFDVAAANSEWAGTGSSQGRLYGSWGTLHECRNDLEFILAERFCNIDSNILLGQIPSTMAYQSPSP